MSGLPFGWGKANEGYVMRMGFWRRVAVALALIFGIGVAAPTVSASATPSAPASTIVRGSSASPGAGAVTTEDWWWGP